MDERVLRGLAAFSASYAKRMLEGEYDRAFATEIGQKLTNLPKGQRHGIEFALAVSSAVLDQALDGESPLKRFLREIAVDASPEMSKRLMNRRWYEAVPPELAARTGSGGRTTSSDGPGGNDGDVLAALFDLDEDDLGPTVEWLLQATPDERHRALTLLENLSSEHLARLLRLNATDRDRMLELVGEMENMSQKKKEEHWLYDLTTRWENWVANKGRD